jgi:hypothetical protein
VAKDFHPAYGTFRSKVYRVDIDVAGRPLTLHAGVLPEPLARRFDLGDRWIIGADFFRDRVIELDYPSRVIDHTDRPNPLRKGTTATHARKRQGGIGIIFFGSRPGPPPALPPMRGSSEVC